MIIEKTYMTTVILKNPIEIYSSNINEYILKNLKNRFEKKTYKSSFILEILKINYRSLIRRGNDLKSNAYIDVNFLAKSIIYDIGEVIANCKIIRRAEHGAYYCESDYAKIELKFNKNLSVLHNQINFVPIEIIKTKYDFLEKNIKIISRIFKPYKKDDLFFVVKKNDSILMNNEKIKSARKHEKYTKDILMSYVKNKEDEDKLKSFIDLFYPYKNKINFSDVYKEMKNIDISDIEKKNVNSENDYVYFKPQIISDYDDICLYSSDKIFIDNIIKKKNFIQINIEGVIEYYINKKIKYMNNLISFMKTFKTTKNVKNNNLYFEMFVKNKLIFKR